MQYYVTLTNSQIDYLINEKIHSKRDRQIMKLRMIDGMTYESIAEICEMSVIQIKRIVQRCTKMIPI